LEFGGGGNELDLEWKERIDEEIGRGGEGAEDIEEYVEEYGGRIWKRVGLRG
jgi:hypothetical protein